MKIKQQVYLMCMLFFVIIVQIYIISSAGPIVRIISITAIVLCSISILSFVLNILKIHKIK